MTNLKNLAAAFMAGAMMTGPAMADQIHDIVATAQTMFIGNWAISVLTSASPVPTYRMQHVDSNGDMKRMDCGPGLYQMMFWSEQKFDAGPVSVTMTIGGRRRQTSVVCTAFVTCLFPMTQLDS